MWQRLRALGSDLSAITGWLWLGSILLYCWYRAHQGGMEWTILCALYLLLMVGGILANWWVWRNRYTDRQGEGL